MEVKCEQAPSVCRGCLTSECGMVNATVYNTIFKDLTGINISPSDGLPQSLCYECSAFLQKCVKFRGKVIKSHKLLCQYMLKGIPIAYKEITSPHLSRTSIMCFDILSGHVEELERQNDSVPFDTGRSLITKVIGAEVKEEVIVNECVEDSTEERDEINSQVDITEESYFDLDSHKICTMTSNHEKQIEQRDSEEQTEPDLDEDKLNLDVNDTDEFNTGSVDVKVEYLCSDDEDYITIEECDVYVPEKIGLATQGKKSVDTITSEVNESEQVTVKCEQNKFSSDVTVDKKYKCDICMKCFKQKNNLSNHFRIHTGDKPYKCRVCMKCFENKNDLTVHYQTHTDYKLLQCDVCMKYFSKRENLIVHIRTHTGEKPFQCEKCMKCFTDGSNLNRHYRTHSVNNSVNKSFVSVQCDVCMKYFKHRHSLTLHYRLHTGYKPYKCDVCNKRFRRCDDLTVHSREHTGDKPYKCDLCKKGFKRKSALNRHYNTHTSDKPFQCHICKKGFKRNSDLSIHHRVHTKDKPFQCDICMKRFTVKCNLNKHYQTHTGVKL